MKPGGAAPPCVKPGGTATSDSERAAPADNRAQTPGCRGPALLVLRSMRGAAASDGERAATGPQLGKTVAWRGQASHGDGVASNGPLP